MDEMKSYIFALLFALIVAPVSGCRTSAAATAGGTPSHLKPGWKYEAAQVAASTILQISENGWIRVRDRSGRPAWLNTNATQVIWAHYR
jgi:hypothetical protein